MEITDLGLVQSCPICVSKMKQCFTGVILSKYDISYFRCQNCGLLQTEQPYWSKEAYGSAIADLDVGLVQRNVQLSKLINIIIDRYFDPYGKFLDFAGGYGLLVRLMRDMGFDFYRYDKYCDNLFAKYFDIQTLTDMECKFELITASEVLEHVYDPVYELKKLFEVTDSVLFTTEISPKNIQSVDDWWYFVPESGQHISFYTKESLHQLANIFSVNYFSNGSSYHLFTKRTFKEFTFTMQKKQFFLSKLLRKVRRENNKSGNDSLRTSSISTFSDFKHIKNIIKTNK